MALLSRIARCLCVGEGDGRDDGIGGEQATVHGFGGGGATADANATLTGGGAREGICPAGGGWWSSGAGSKVMNLRGSEGRSGWERGRGVARGKGAGSGEEGDGAAVGDLGGRRGGVAPALGGARPVVLTGERATWAELGAATTPSRRG
jgi:hypothetical protein